MLPHTLSISFSFRVTIPQTESLEHWHGAEGGVADRDQCAHVLRVQRLQGREVLEGVRVERREPAKSWISSSLLYRAENNGWWYAVYV